VFLEKPPKWRVGKRIGKVLFDKWMVFQIIGLFVKFWRNPNFTQLNLKPPGKEGLGNKKKV